MRRMLSSGDVPAPRRVSQRARPGRAVIVPRPIVELYAWKGAPHDPLPQEQVTRSRPGRGGAPASGGTGFGPGDQRPSAQPHLRPRPGCMVVPAWALFRAAAGAGADARAVPGPVPAAP